MKRKTPLQEEGQTYKNVYWADQENQTARKGSDWKNKGTQDSKKKKTVHSNAVDPHGVL